MIDHIPSTVEVEKPWGRFERYTHNILSTVKVITVERGGTLSLQYHHRRDELWVVLDSGALIEVGDAILRPSAGAKVFIPRTVQHRLSAVGDSPVRILEISFGEFEEDDIVRLEDVYGRVGVHEGVNEDRSLQEAL
jgi:mannose-1-phosphate guanylyltransferase/mannose-6-phosphate isomerase